MEKEKEVKNSYKPKIIERLKELDIEIELLADRLNRTDPYDNRDRLWERLSIFRDERDILLKELGIIMIYEWAGLK
jgi:hypothetical protein